MALPQASDMNKYNGSKLTNTDWDGNVDSTVSFLSSGNYDLNVGNITAKDITADTINVEVTNGVPTGSIQKMATTFAPSGYLRTNGANYVISTQPQLFYATGHTYGPGDGTPVVATNVSITNNVCTITAVGHGMSNAEYTSILFTDVASTVAINRGVQVENITPNTFDFSIENWEEQPVMPCTICPATTFPVPDTRGYVDRDVDSTATIDPDAATRTNRGDGTTGAQVGTKQPGQLSEHRHPLILNDGYGEIVLEPPYTDNSGQGIGFSLNGQSITSGNYGPRIMYRVTSEQNTGSSQGWIHNPSGVSVDRYYPGDTGGDQVNTINIALYYYIKT